MAVLPLYAESVSCLENVFSNIQISPDFNKDTTLNIVQHCHGIVQQLMTTENDQLLVNVLWHLLKCLESHHRKIAKWKKKQSEHPISDTSPSEKSKFKQNRITAIEDSIYTKSHLTFNDVAGLSDAKQALYEAIIMPLQFPHLFTGNRRPWKRILLYGPPGTGKSRLALALSSAITSTFYSISSANLLSSWVGESEKSIKELFQHACRNKSKSVIFIDEIDSLCRKRNVQEEEHTRRFKTELLKQMEGVGNTETKDNIFLLCATNCPWELDVAFLRRFQKRIYIPLPDKNLVFSQTQTCGTHTEVQMAFLEKCLLSSVLVFDTIAKKILDGKYLPCESYHPQAIRTDLKDLPAASVIPHQVTLEDFIKSTQTHTKTVSENDLKQFKDFTQRFGELG
ncbi:protein SUPPRESSOR OF K(+) TRANSPORT GROWTH DEFECT 1-like [Octopus sinensis]|uniref:Protein SUPPRESSOR OF K(+) TRANSPORT GROWTH DEFECT 1-like n=1 Tax=Octopus sinensis TaxID=2607531 RepID=A0A7E6ES02_9MOLL|nr:protein SUPPRESSOR OF K(+) TRANSPORT GROWTH DEFECT 1-like [Octopus sinensis]